jgi:methylated-DNA-protein-cysteine methyltransferase related protein
MSRRVQVKRDRVVAERSKRESRIAGIIQRIRHIPEGSVRTYGEIDPAAPRLVGRVLATTDEGLPWHRVIRADGSIPKGKTQRELLLGEGIAMRGDRVDLDRARLNLPAVVAGYLRAADASDVKALVSCFTDDAEVTDEGRTWGGHAEIRRWWNGPATKYQYTVEVRGGKRMASDRYVLQVRLTGNFPGGTADVRYRFMLREGLVAALEIAP